MRQAHPAGEKLFVDYAGDTVAVFDQVTGAERPAHIFVAALGASNYTYAEARWSEGLYTFLRDDFYPYRVQCFVDKRETGVRRTNREFNGLEVAKRGNTAQ